MPHTTNAIREHYLGDGIYVSASADDHMIVLRAPRPSGDHWIALEPAVLDNLIVWVQRNRRAPAHTGDNAIAEAGPGCDWKARHEQLRLDMQEMRRIATDLQKTILQTLPDADKGE